VLFTLPFIVLTMGLGLVVINALLFLLVGELVEGFQVAGFWDAFWAAVIVGLTNFFMTLLMKQRPPRGPCGGAGGGGDRRPARREPGGDVIDV
jgi:putative membrane protein